MKQQDGDGVIPLRVARAGRTRGVRGFAGGVVLAAAALREAVGRGLFEGTPVFFRHAREDGRDLRDMAGVLAGAAFDEAEGAVVAELHPFSTSAGAELAALAADLRRYRTRGIPAPDVGVSVDAFMVFDRAAEPPVARQVTEVMSVDIVFRPAADGRILAQEEGGTSDELRDTRAEGQGAGGGWQIAAGKWQGTGGERVVVLSEMDLSDGFYGGRQMSLQTTDGQGEMAQGGWEAAAQRQATAAALAASGLPEVVRRRLAARRYESPEALETAIDEARDELAQLSAAQVIQIGGQAPRARIGGMSTGLEQMGAALDWLFGVRSAPPPEPALRSVRAVYHTLTGDYDFYGRFDAERVALEGATTSSLANLAANAMNKVIVQQFSALTFWRWYEHIAYPTPNDGSVQEMQWTVIGGIANLPTVPEKGAYDELEVSDTGETDAFVKYGGYVPITLELIRNSDIQRLQAIPRALALAAVRTRSAKVAEIFMANDGVGPTLSQDSTALFHTDHGNLATTAFGSTATAWRAARAECFKQTELGSDSRLGLFPKYWLGPADLYDQALALFGYGEGQPAVYTPEAQGRNVHDPRPLPLAVPDFGDATDWAYIVDPLVFPVIHISYAQAPGGGVHPAPELFTVASPTAGLMFSNDVLPIKVRDWFAVGVNGYRGIGKRNVAG